MNRNQTITVTAASIAAAVAIGAGTFYAATEVVPAIQMKKELEEVAEQVERDTGAAEEAPPEEEPAYQEEYAESEEAIQGPVPIDVGRAHQVVDNKYGESYTVTVDSVRYLEEINVTDDTYSWDVQHDTWTSFEGDGYFAVIDMTYTNDETQSQEFLWIFDTYVDDSGNTVSNEDAISYSNPDSYASYTAEDVGAEALISEATVPAGATVKASEVVAVPQKGGDLYDTSGEYYLNLPPE